uniref:Uncharacterized protein n=1 Tax=Knipowitschia caucasica TaxID=637954 RepID=A0AAV2LQM9_KNICA
MPMREKPCASSPRFSADRTSMIRLRRRRRRWRMRRMRRKRRRCVHPCSVVPPAHTLSQTRSQTLGLGLEVSLLPRRSSRGE